MFPEERKQKIYDIVCTRKSVKVSELSNLLKISAVTIRRDLDELDSQNRVMRTHGGAVALYSVGRALRALELTSSNIEAKKLIAAHAYSYINDNDTILTDSSSTVYELIKLIAEGNKRSLIVVTTSIPALTVLSKREDFKVIAVGGEVNYFHDTFEGSLALELIRGLRADKSFIGVNGIDRKFGCSTPRFEDAEIKKSLMESSIQSFILADSTKFGKTYLAKVNAACDFVITDSRQIGYQYDWLENRGTVIFASELAKKKGSVEGKVD